MDWNPRVQVRPVKAMVLHAAHGELPDGAHRASQVPKFSTPCLAFCVLYNTSSTAVSRFTYHIYIYAYQNLSCHRCMSMEFPSCGHCLNYDNTEFHTSV